MNGDYARLNQYIIRNHLSQFLKRLAEVQFLTFLRPPLRPEAKNGQKKFVGGNNIVKIFLQTDFQKDWAKDKEMTGIFHLFSFFLKKHETRPLCPLFFPLITCGNFLA